jgi:hypothetical protein
MRDVWCVLCTLIMILAFVLSGATRAESGPLAPGEHVAELNGLRLWYKVSGTGPVCLLPNPPWGAEL